MRKKLKQPCPNCHAYKVWSRSPAGFTLTLLLGSLIVACIPIIGWFFIIPLALLDIILLPLTIILYCIPIMRVVTARCSQCSWKGNPEELSVQTA